ncbi:MAG: WbqC family protein, partial [Pedobacter sp.]|nr:WbqC family protein [Pedobacter sp.]
MQDLAIFPLFYLPPVVYFSALKTHGFEFLLEKNEHFPKQTFRNRASIASPNGILALTIPVVKGAKVHTPIKDVKISDTIKWQRLHWLSLETCYRSSAYFEYYEADLVRFYEKKYTFLFDFNLELLNWLFDRLKIENEPNFTDTYSDYPEALDYRNKFSKKEIYTEKTKPYFQVF